MKIKISLFKVSLSLADLAEYKVLYLKFLFNWNIYKMSTVNDHNEGSNDFTVGDVDVAFSIKHGAAA